MLLYAALLMLSYDCQYVEFVNLINQKLHYTHACKHKERVGNLCAMYVRCKVEKRIVGGKIVAYVKK